MIFVESSSNTEINGYWYISFIKLNRTLIYKKIINPKKTGGGLNQDEGSSSARHDLGDEVMVVKPSCNYHFWCLWLEENKNFGGCIKFFWKICVRKIFFCKKLNRKFWKIQFLQKIFYQTVLFNIKYQFEIISAFIWCIYCQY